ncbi:MAG: ergothioneine biosynthesis protein EgtC [Streptosporangiales bacterium]|nr:ergothioneine biosynthesis protein EgtC [Streptosporangiales bacterium]
MCRHLAYLGPAVSLKELILDPEHGLYRQSWAPRRQRHGTVNADGFGVGWYAGDDPVPARYRRDIPIWNDESLPGIARVTRSGAVLAAVRSATPGMALGAAAAAPFGAGTWLFSHNGAVSGWETLQSRVSVRDMDVLSDSAVLWALTLARLRTGAEPGPALAAVIAEAEAAGAAGRFNLLLTDGTSIAATAAGDTLCYRARDGGVVIASEPGDDRPGWADVPDRHLLTAGPHGLAVAPLSDLTEGVTVP